MGARRRGTHRAWTLIKQADGRDGAAVTVQDGGGDARLAGGGMRWCPFWSSCWRKPRSMRVPQKREAVAGLPFRRREICERVKTSGCDVNACGQASPLARALVRYRRLVESV